MDTERVGRAPRQTRRTLGMLLLAWTFVTACIATIASAYWARTGDLAILISWLAAPFLVGLVLFIAVGVTSIAGRAAGGTSAFHVEAPDGLKRREIFGTRKR